MRNGCHLTKGRDNDELYFRDYLREYPEIANKYEQLKLSLRKQFEHDRDGYTEAKTEFVKRYTAEAKSLYGRNAYEAEKYPDCGK